MPSDMILCIADLQDAASKKLPKPVREFYNSGSEKQVTLAENSSAFSKYRLRTRVLKDVAGVQTKVKVFDNDISFPLCVSPVGIQAMAHPGGELATSRACAKKNVHMGISSYATFSAEEVVAVGKEVGPISHVMQLYTMHDRGLQERIIQRAEKAGCKAIFLTADSAVLGLRYNEPRNDFRTSSGLSFPMQDKTSEQVRAQTHNDTFTAFNSDSHSWAREIPYLRSLTRMEIWIKGILTAEDVELAIEYGCDGVIISNHGGRQLDESPATIDVLPECARAAKGKIRLHVDSGIRSGADIFKAIALGAECCWVGRPAIWGLAYDGQQGVELMLETLYQEFKRCMQLTGCRTVSEISPACLGVVRADGPLARL